ncbi:MAG: MerR family transcriptional regulator [Spirochaetaceae bacterium]|nr:MerR family transcriptional regulator [Spirochaetaceae bacterium]
MYTISRLGEIFGLSRSTLLYYDSIGLLPPSRRSAAGYRLYAEEDRTRLEKIVAYRAAGIPLERIGAFLEAADSGPSAMLMKRVFEINSRIEDLRGQQRLILDLLEADGGLKGAKDLLAGMEELGKRIGVTPANALRLHGLFERASPSVHRRLLAFLGFSEKDIGEFLSHIEKGR